MEIVGSRLGLDQDDRAITATKLGGEVVGDDLKFFDGRKRCALAVLVFGRVVVIDAVDLESRAARAGAVEVDRRAGRRGRIVLARSRILLKAGEGFGESQKVALIERRLIENLLRVE